MALWQNTSSADSHFHLVFLPFLQPPIPLSISQKLLSAAEKDKSPRRIHAARPILFSHFHPVLRDSPSQLGRIRYTDPITPSAPYNEHTSRWRRSHFHFGVHLF